MYIRAYCPTGHRVKALACYAGRTRNCPECDKPIVFPSPKASREITDTSVLQLLGDAQQKPPSTTARIEQIKHCPRCEARLAESDKTCYRCHLYLAASASGWTRAVQAATRQEP